MQNFLAACNAHVQLFFTGSVYLYTITATVHTPHVRQLITSVSMVYTICKGTWTEKVATQYRTKNINHLLVPVRPSESATDKDILSPARFLLPRLLLPRQSSSCEGDKKHIINVSSQHKLLHNVIRSSSSSLWRHPPRALLLLLGLLLACRCRTELRLGLAPAS